jgi:hypothetical protein
MEMLYSCTIPYDTTVGMLLSSTCNMFSVTKYYIFLKF